MNILITGGTGFIGSHLIHRLVNEGHSIFAVVRPDSSLYRIQKYLTKIRLVEIDSDFKNVRVAFEKQHIDGVIHLATFYRKEDSALERHQMEIANVGFPKRIMKLARRHRVRFFINTGTCFEYLESNEPICEESPIRPYNYYAETKVQFEKWLKTYQKKSSINVLTLKLFFPYGEKDNNKLVRLVIEHILHHTQIHVTHGDQTLSYTYVDDIVDAYIRALAYVVTDTRSYEVINIGGSPVRLSALFDTIETIADNKNTLIRDKAYAQNEIMSMYTNSKKADMLLGWKQKWSLKKGLKKTFDYYLHTISYD